METIKMVEQVMNELGCTAEVNEGKDIVETAIDTKSLDVEIFKVYVTESGQMNIEVERNLSPLVSKNDVELEFIKSALAFRIAENQ